MAVAGGGSPRGRRWVREATGSYSSPMECDACGEDDLFNGQSLFQCFPSHPDLVLFLQGPTFLVHGGRDRVDFPLRVGVDNALTLALSDCSCWVNDSRVCVSDEAGGGGMAYVGAGGSEL